MGLISGQPTRWKPLSLLVSSNNTRRALAIACHPIDIRIETCLTSAPSPNRTGPLIVISITGQYSIGPIEALMRSCWTRLLFWRSVCDEATCQTKLSESRSSLVVATQSSQLETNSWVESHHVTHRDGKLLLATRQIIDLTLELLDS